jgi:hypothetical protein
VGFVFDAVSRLMGARSGLLNGGSSLCFRGTAAVVCAAGMEFSQRANTLLTGRSDHPLLRKCGFAERGNAPRMAEGGS